MVTQVSDRELRAELRKKSTTQLRFLVETEGGPEVVKMAKEVLWERGKANKGGIVK